jgi:PKD domain-containing protein
VLARIRVAFLAIVVGSGMAVAFPLSAIAAECTQQMLQTTGCPSVSAGVGNGQATLEGSAGSPGSGARSGGGGGASVPADPLARCIYVLNNRCLVAGPGRAGPVQPITLRDIASFRPNPGQHLMEPNGWMIVGLDTNFYSSAGAHVINGTLLGQPASVRFTPVSWHWTYGDGTGATRSTRGGTWASQGIPEFDPTPTSHIYRAPGTYNIDLTIDFRAEYRFAGMPWTSIAGILTLPSNRLVATAGDAKTVLVERECTENPSGPGC